MSYVLKCPDCGNITRFDKSGDGKCDKCGEIMAKIEEEKLKEKDRKILAENDIQGDPNEINQCINLDNQNKDILEK